MSETSFTEWTEEQVKATLPKREVDSHKGTFGTGLLLAGSDDMPGAALLAGLGAMRCGIGKLVIGTSNSVVPLVVPNLPEATYWRNGWEKIEEVSLEDSYKAIAIGPGLPSNEKVERAVERLLGEDCPLVIDAGALSKRNYPKRKAPVIITPHPGEFCKITGVEMNELQENRASLTKKWARELGVTIVLKGSETIIAFPDGDGRINVTGNSALAKGGTGDTLTGMILGMLCCHKNPKVAVLNAVHLHGACADEWIKKHSSHTLLAHELMDQLPHVWKTYE